MMVVVGCGGLSVFVLSVLAWGFGSVWVVSVVGCG